MRDPLLTERAKQMRKEMTEPELRLWFQLRATRFESVKFRKQKVVGRYIVDFAARKPMLVIEVDGDTHGDRQHYDDIRTKYLETQGYRIIRVSNADVMGNMDGVLTMISEAIGTAPLPTLSPEGERALCAPASLPFSPIASPLSPSPPQVTAPRLPSSTRLSRAGRDAIKLAR